MTKLMLIIAVVSSLGAGACSNSSETCATEAPISCSVTRESYGECSAPALCAGVCNAAGTCCYCEDGDWKRLEVSCGRCADAGVVPDAEPVDAGAAD